MLDTTWGSTYFHRQEVLNAMLKDQLRDSLIGASNWVNWISDFTDGSNYKIASVGELSIDQAAEATSLPDRRPDAGQFIFNINEYIGSKTSFTDDFIEEDHMANTVLQTLPERMKRAMDEYIETRVFHLQNQQTANDPNTINGARHRYTANGSGATITVQDIAYAGYALDKAGVPRAGRVAVVDPSFEFNTNIQTGLSDMTYNPNHQGIIETGIGDSTGMRWIRNIYGFDIYVSNYLDTITTAESSLTDYNGNTTAGAVGYKANLFFSTADRMNMPFIGAWRRMPTFSSWRDEDKRIEYHQMLARFGLKLYRPENLIVMLSSTTLN